MVWGAVRSRTEFIRDILRDAVILPEFDRADPKAIAASGVDIQGPLRTGATR